MKSILTIIVICLIFCGNVAFPQRVSRPRTIVTTDGEVDDQDSFIRLLLYSNELNIQGLVYTSSEWHYKGDGKGTKFTSEMQMTKDRYGARTELRWIGTSWMQSLIDKYGLVYENLLKHDKNYPAPKYLESIIRIGNIDFEGEMGHNTEGSDFIKNILLDDKPGPVYIQNWGGTNTAARALKAIEDEYKHTSQWESVYKKVSRKAALYIILDQDATYKKYILPHWPDVRVIYNSSQFWSLAYGWPRVVPPELQQELKGKWMAENIKFNHGTLLSSYFLWGDGQRLAGDSEHTQGDIAEAKKFGFSQYDFLSEGDSPAFLYLLDVGLRSLEDASYGGWAGRMVKAPGKSQTWQDGTTVTDYNPYTGKADLSFPQTRWITALQNDFAARANWCVQPYDKANHAPLVKLDGATGLTAKPGAVIKLSGSATDPDGDDLSYRWWQYEEAGSYAGKVMIRNPENKVMSFVVPNDAKKGDTIHIILEVKDNGSPSLTRYRLTRIIVN